MPPVPPTHLRAQNPGYCIWYLMQASACSLLLLHEKGFMMQSLGSLSRSPSQNHVRSVCAGCSNRPHARRAGQGRAGQRPTQQKWPWQREQVMWLQPPFL